MRRFLLVAALVSALAWLAPTERSDAFGTLNSGGQKQEHAEITRRALYNLGFDPPTLWALGGGREPGRDGGTTKFGAVGAPDRPDHGLVLQSDAHCDNGDWSERGNYPRSKASAQVTLETCRDWILRHMDAAVDAASEMISSDGAILPAETPDADQCVFRRRESDPARCRALGHLGLAMHAAQDFYSHSNWTDAVSTPGLAPGLGQNGPAPWLQSRQVAFPDGLISGCFRFVPESWFCRGRIRHEDLSKDKGDVGQANGRTPRGEDGNFGRAAEAAIDDTRGRWTALEGALLERHGPERTALILCAVRSDRGAVCAAP